MTKTILACLTLIAATLFSATQVHARILLKSICRVKGMEEVTLQGLGLVVGLKGTGDGADALPTIRALARSMELMGMPLGPVATKGQGGGLRELKDAKNVALVMVTATVSSGAQRGDSIECQVSALSAKSLAGGRLFMTPLVGPDIKSRRVYALAQGQIKIDDVKAPTTGKIHRGMRLEEDFPSPDFTRDGKLVLILDRDRADYQVAADIAELLNSQVLSTEPRKARALDNTRIEVPIPDVYLARSARVSPSGSTVKENEADPVVFISQVLSQPVPEPEVEARVVINERAESIVFSADVEIGATVVTHGNIVVEVGSAPGKFVALDPERKSQQPGSTRLQALVDALNAVNCTAKDKIDIIKGIERDGKLHAKLIIE
jgi:flagellar P-ring protein precursor FlgI